VIQLTKKDKINRYNKTVEKMSVGIHESWMRSRQTMMNRYGKNTRQLNGEKTMEEHFMPNMISYDELPDDVKEFDRMEARGILATINRLPLYLTQKEKREFNKCLIDTKGSESNIKCFRELKLYYPELRK
jgi:hypothetical protein